MEKLALRFLILTGLFKVGVCDVFGNDVFSLLPMTWSEAREHCRDHYTDLSSINSQDEDKNLKAAVPVWIGLYKDANETWSWSGGKAASFFSWASSRSASKTNRCVAASSDGWVQMDCEQKLLGFYCFKSDLVLVKENKTWEQALDWCHRLNKNLISLASESALVQALQTIREAPTDHVWTSQRYLAGTWLWVDGANKNQVWGQDKMPQCPKWSQHCGILSTKEQHWSSWDCADKLNFFCD